MNSPFIETLESRELLSAVLGGAFSGKIPIALPPGDSAPVAIRLSDSGDAPLTGGVRVSLFASATPDLAVDATLLISSTRAQRVAVGHAEVFSFRVPSPSNLPDGSYYLVAKIDSVSGDAPEAVIASPHTVSIAQPYVDLTGAIVSQPQVAFVSNLRAGRGLARVRVTNEGNAPAQGPMQITVYASASGSLDANSIPVGVAIVRNLNLKAGGSRVFAAQLLVPPGTAYGNYTILAAINSAHTVQEVNASNNIATGLTPMAVLSAPTFAYGGHTGHGGNAGTGIGGGVYLDIGSVYVDDSGGPDTIYDDGGDTAPPATGPADSNPGDTTAPTGNGPTTAPVDTSGDTGSDFGSDPGGDSGGGADF